MPNVRRRTRHGPGRHALADRGRLCAGLDPDAGARSPNRDRASTISSNGVFALGLFAAMAPSEATRGTRRQGRASDHPCDWRHNRPSDRSDLRAVAAIRLWRESSSRARELAQLSAEIASADKPVISDDMVLLIRSGREVLWEPAIFAELASTGDWDERPFVRRYPQWRRSLSSSLGGGAGTTASTSATTPPSPKRSMPPIPSSKRSRDSRSTSRASNHRRIA